MNSVSPTLATAQSCAVGKKGSRPAEDTRIQFIFREFLRRRVERVGRPGVAAALDCSPQAVDYLRAGKPGRYVNMWHLQKLAEAEQMTLRDMFIELAKIAMVTEAGLLLPEDGSPLPPDLSAERVAAESIRMALLSADTAPPTRAKKK
jgi:hypothetical protein